ncbi:MAG: hypothetical protein MJY56_00520, partial [Bacteroidales bacterium]|nr:hypothetical protein [Bacteroidales bacterium]
MKHITITSRIAALAVAVLFSLAPLRAASPAWDSVKSANAGWGSIDVRYPKDEPAAVSTKAARLYAWKGEKVSAELVLSTPKTINSFSVSVSDLKSGR